MFAQLSSLFGKNSDYSAEYNRFKKAMARNSRDHGLKAQFIKFCLLNRFTKHETMESHIAEALALFETIDHTEAFDLQCHYLVGKYYQEVKDFRKAYQVYLGAIKHFNRYVGKNPDLKSDNVELAFSVALNLMTLQSNPIDRKWRGVSGSSTNPTRFTSSGLSSRMKWRKPAARSGPGQAVDRGNPKAQGGGRKGISGARRRRQAGSQRIRRILPGKFREGFRSRPG